MAEKFEFEAPQFVDSWKEVMDVNDFETFFKENEDKMPSSSSRRLTHTPYRTPRNVQRPHSFAVVSRSGRRCRRSLLRDSSLISKEKESFNKKFLNSGKENETGFTFKARPASVLKKEPFWPYRGGRKFTEGQSPVFETEKRSKHRQALMEIRKKREEMYEAENLMIIKEDEDELRRYRKTLEFKANPIKF